jgi:polynucleotide 5'-kinase involved in rRNA processing
MVPGTSLRLESSGFAKIRTREDRKEAREAGYRRFLNGSKPLRMRLEDVRVRMFDQPEQTLFAGGRNFSGLIAGLLGADDVLITIGRVKEVLRGMALVETQTREMPSVLELGSVVLSSKYEEVGYSVLH